MRDLNRAEVDVFLLVGEGDSTGSESNDANDDEEYPDNGDGLHGSAAFPEQCDGMLIGGDLDALVGWVSTATCPADRLGSNLLLHGKGGWSSL